MQKPEPRSPAERRTADTIIRAAVNIVSVIDDPVEHLHGRTAGAFWFARFYELYTDLNFARSSDSAKGMRITEFVSASGSWFHAHALRPAPPHEDVAVHHARYLATAPGFALTREFMAVARQLTDPTYTLSPNRTLLAMASIVTATLLLATESGEYRHKPLLLTPMMDRTTSRARTLDSARINSLKEPSNDRPQPQPE